MGISTFWKQSPVIDSTAAAMAVRVTTPSVSRIPNARAGTAVDHASGIRFDGVSVMYGQNTVLDTLNLTVPPGEIVALIGPSGSGKTTALRAVAGFATPSQGRITIGGRDVTHLAPSERDIGMVVQNYALFPHMRVEDNVAFGLRARNASKQKVRTQVDECLRLVGMTDYAKRYPRELSGGQQQRVAIARALAIQPKVLLLDEPLSALDAQIRRSMLEELAKLHRDLPALTVLYVTHDQTEALTLADHIGIMREGKLVAFGTSQALYRHPPNRFAAEFLGRANVFPVRGLQRVAGEQRNDVVEATEAPQHPESTVGDASNPLVRDVPDDSHSTPATAHFRDTTIRGRNYHALPEGVDCLLCVRPHNMSLSRRSDRDNCVTGIVQSAVWLGEVLSIEMDVDSHTLRLNAPPLNAPPVAGTPLTMYFDPADVTFIPDPDAAPTPGFTIEPINGLKPDGVPLSAHHAA